MDDRLDRLERLAALHCDGALTNDEFREEKLRVLDAGWTAGQPAMPPSPPVQAEPVPLGPSPATETGRDPDFGEREPFDLEARRGGVPWLLVAVAVLVVLGAAALFASSAFRDTSPMPVPTVGKRAAADPAYEAILNAVAPEPVVEPEKPEVADLGAALAFRDAGNCEFTASAEQAFRALLTEGPDRWSPTGPVQLAGVSATPELEVINKDDVIEGGRIYVSSTRLPEGTLWNGLKLSRLVRSHGSYPDTDDFDERSITFLEEPERVQRTLRRLGVSVPVGGNGRGLEDGSCGGVMTISAIPGGSALTCQWGC